MNFCVKSIHFGIQVESRSQRGARSVNITLQNIVQIRFFGLIVCLVGSYRLSNESKTKHHVIFFRYNNDNNDIIIL